MCKLYSLKHEAVLVFYEWLVLPFLFPPSPCVSMLLICDYKSKSRITKHAALKFKKGNQCEMRAVVSQNHSPSCMKTVFSI